LLRSARSAFPRERVRSMTQSSHGFVRNCAMHDEQNATVVSYLELATGTAGSKPG
jgi:hypothetical protein